MIPGVELRESGPCLVKGWREGEVGTGERGVEMRWKEVGRGTRGQETREVGKETEVIMQGGRETEGK